ncbi:MAG: hypothetical protein ABIM89_11765 [Mycobacteriales bacterium]
MSNEEPININPNSEQLDDTEGHLNVYADAEQAEVDDDTEGHRVLE